MNIPTRAVVFYILTFFFTVLFGGTQQALGITGGTLQIAQLGPGCAALVMIFLLPNGWKKLTFTLRSSEFRLYLFAFGIPLGVSLAIGFLYQRLFVSHVSSELMTSAATGGLTASVPMIVLGILLGAFGEEVGWRGYLQRLLDKGKNSLLPSVLVGALWGAWHVSNYQYGLVYMLFFILLMIASSVLLRLLLENTDNYLFLGFLFHCGINIGMYPTRASLTDVRIIMLGALLWCIALGVALVFRWSALRKSDNQTGD